MDKTRQVCETCEYWVEKYRECEHPDGPHGPYNAFSFMTCGLWERAIVHLDHLAAAQAEQDETQRNLREKTCIVERQREQIAELEKELAAAQAEIEKARETAIFILAGALVPTGDLYSAPMYRVLLSEHDVANLRRLAAPGAPEKGE